MTHRVGAKGQIVIPKGLRDRAGLQPGSEVDFALEGDRVVLTARRRPRVLRGRFAGSGMVARLLEDRHCEHG
jgi:AbrB family looped-hinge helix DNA binding protein